MTLGPDKSTPAAVCPHQNGLLLALKSPSLCMSSEQPPPSPAAYKTGLTGSLFHRRRPVPDTGYRVSLGAVWGCGVLLDSLSLAAQPASSLRIHIWAQANTSASFHPPAHSASKTWLLPSSIPPPWGRYCLDLLMGGAPVGFIEWP